MFSAMLINQASEADETEYPSIELRISGIVFPQSRRIFSVLSLRKDPV
jgi:hypothetical protein